MGAGRLGQRVLEMVSRACNVSVKVTFSFEINCWTVCVAFNACFVLSA